MRIPLTPRRPTAAVRAGLDAWRGEVLRDLAKRGPDTGVDRAVARSRVKVFERVRTDIDRIGLEGALTRAAASYRQVPVVPMRLRGRHPAARARGEAFERVFEAAGVDPEQVERLRRLRPRFVDEPQAAS